MKSLAERYLEFVSTTGLAIPADAMKHHRRAYYSAYMRGIQDIADASQTGCDLVKEANKLIEEFEKFWLDETREEQKEAFKKMIGLN